MLFEAALCLRPVVALGYFDGFHVNTSKRYFSHFEGMEQVPGFRFYEEPSSLSEAIETALAFPPLLPSKIISATSFFLTQAPPTYPQRLSKLVSIASEPSSESK
jgi:hypothetical protein